MKWITAQNLATWGGALQARTMLPALVGDLILASVSEISHFRFPGGDKGQVRGFDGVVEINASSPFIPKGRSIWEFGVSADATSKADKDYAKRTNEVAKADRQNLTFVFVSLRTWDNPQKKLDKWVADKVKLGDWKDVRYVDGSQLESWLDLNPAVSAGWAGAILGAPLQNGAMSTDEFWADYSSRFDTPLTEEVLLCDREDSAEALIQFLATGSGRYPLVADSLGEVVAFAVAAIRKAEPAMRQYLEARTLIVESPNLVRFLSRRADTIFFPCGAAIAQAAVLAQAGPTLVPLVRNRPGKRDSQLERPTVRSLAKALETMGYSADKSVELARACGRSVTILMRRIPAIEAQPPKWAELGRALVPAMLAGGWSERVDPDLDRLAELNHDIAFTELEKTLAPLASDNDPFIEREREIWRTRSPVDAFVQLGKHLTREDFERLSKVATVVFSEVEMPPDPDAPFAERLAARTLSNSSWLREGLATTLLQIAVLHEEASLHMPDTTPRAYVDGLVGGLQGLKDDPRVMEALRNDLLLLAEAAPIPFLAALEHLLEGDKPKALAFFQESDDVFGRSSSHTHILWSLEVLAWDPTLLPRVTLALARLAAIDPGGRLANRPKATLKSIFQIWAPGTNASWRLRQDLLRVLLQSAPAVGWDLVLDLLPSGRSELSSSTARPRFREAGGGEREVLTNRLYDEQLAFLAEQLILNAGTRADRWVALIRRLPDLAVQHRAAAFDRLEQLQHSFSENDRTTVWRALRTEFNRQSSFAGMAWGLSEGELATYEALVQAFASEDLVERARTLFADTPFAARDYERIQSELREQRRAIMVRVVEAHGLDGVLAVAKDTPAPQEVAVATVEACPDLDWLKTVIEAALTASGPRPFVTALSRAAHDVDAARWETILAELDASALAPGDIADLYLAWADGPDAWIAVAKAGVEVEASYWARKTAFSLDPANVEPGVEHYLAAGRATAAMQAAHYHLDTVSAALLLGMLDGLITELNHGGARADVMTAYYAEAVFAALDKRPEVSAVELAKREFALLGLLEEQERPLALHQIMAEEPAFYFDLIKAVFRAEGEEPRSESTPAEVAVAQGAFKLLMKFDKVPGARDDGVDASALSAWVDAVRSLGQSNGRGAITDQYVGHVLSHAPGDQAFWPGEVVAAEIDRIASDEVERGIEVERFNMRGVTMRGMDDGGAQERDQAAIYRAWAQAAVGWPRTHGVLVALEQTWIALGDEEDRRVRLRQMRD